MYYMITVLQYEFPVYITTEKSTQIVYNKYIHILCIIYLYILIYI